MNKGLLHYLCACGLMIGMFACAKRNFYPDANRPGLSRLTAHGFNVVTAYIDGVPYINPFNKLNGNSLPHIGLINTGTSKDTMFIAWNMIPNNLMLSSYVEEWLTISFPVSKNFTSADILSLKGMRLDSNNAAIQLEEFYDSTNIFGTANIYIVNLTISTKGLLDTVFQCSALFNGIYGSDTITDGRFDFKFDASDLGY
ncbi:MAG TPA: hypothetical protein VKR32_15970 [Puia sp.]|nr:hypothetical protein [Puia sp.]